MRPMHFTITGNPVTKKNHTRRIKRGRRTFTVPSEAQERWALKAVLQLKRQLSAPSPDVFGKVPASTPVNMACTVIRPRVRGVRGDLLNYLAAVSDVLQTAGVVVNDALIVRLDGCAFGPLDNDNPRCEIELTPCDDPTWRPARKRRSRSASHASLP